MLISVIQSLWQYQKEKLMLLPITSQPIKLYVSVDCQNLLGPDSTTKHIDYYF